jgi:hypothetical protein
MGGAMKPLHVIFIVAFALCIFAAIIFSIVLSALPFPVFTEYLTVVFLNPNDPESNFMLSRCTSGNNSLYLITTERYFSFVEEKTFDTTGAKVCTNRYSINECKMNCPYDKCINQNFSCRVLASRYPYGH